MPRAAVNGIELEYECFGTGPTILLVMGIGAQLIYWQDAFCEQLAAEGFRVVRFDNRDVGLSTKLEHLGCPPVRKMLTRSFVGLPIKAPYTLLDMADDAVGLLDALGVERAHIVGASMGGMIAQTIAITHPHRVRSLTSIMSNTGDRLDWVGSIKGLRTMLQPPPRNRAAAIDRAEEFYRVVGSTGFPFDVDGVRDRAGRAYDRCFYPKGFARQMLAILATGSRTGALRFVRVPTLVLHGSADPLIPPRGARTTARAIRGAKLEIIDGMGHDLPRGAWSRIVDSIASLAQAATPRDSAQSSSTDVSNAIHTGM